MGQEVVLLAVVLVERVKQVEGQIGDGGCGSVAASEGVGTIYI